METFVVATASCVTSHAGAATVRPNDFGTGMNAYIVSRIGSSRAAQCLSVAAQQPAVKH